MKPSYKIEIVSPTQAKRWRDAGVEHFYDRVMALWGEMDAGRWNPMASRIDIATDPETGVMFLTGGYHTCSAIEYHGRIVRCMVYRDCDPLLTNQSKAFTPAQALAIALSQERNEKVTPTVAGYIDTASRVLMKQDGINYKQMTTRTHAATIIEKYPALIGLGVQHSRDLSGASRNTVVPASTYLLWLALHPELPASFGQHALWALAERVLPPEVADSVAVFSAARSYLTKLGKAAKAGGYSDTKEGRHIPRERVLATLDFALERTHSGSTITSQQGFAQEATTHLKKLEKKGFKRI
jgi:hypothetical protein